MKLSAFKTMLRELIREEVQYAVKKELKVLTEQTKLTKKNSAAKPYSSQGNSLVALDEPLGMLANSPFASLLQETANNMAGFGEEVTTANPDFPLGSNGTDAFVRDYSEVLKKSQGIR